MINRNLRRHLSNLARTGLAAAGLLAGTLSASTAFAQDLEGNYNPSTATVPGRVVRPSPHAGVSLLRSFYYRFLNGDHHIGGITVGPERPAAEQTTLIFKDINGDDPYYYHTQHAPVDPSGMVVGTFGQEICRGICDFAINRPAGDYVFVLRGFAFSWVSGTDHQLEHMGIYEQNGNLTVAFHDGHTTDSNDNYLVTVQYAYVPRSRFASTGTAEGWDVSGGAQRQPIPSGTSVIRGFDVGFTSGDHHIEELGFFQWGTGNVDAYFNDVNDDDLFNWAVDWGVLN